MISLTKARPDRIDVLTWLLVACFASVLLLSSQSGAALVTYILALVVLATAQKWNDVAGVRLFWWVLVTVVWLAVSSLWSQPFSVGEVFSFAVRSLLILCFVVALAEVQMRGKVQAVLRRVMIGVGLLAAIAAIIVFYITQPEDGRLNGLGQLDTHVVAALVSGFVLILALQVLSREDARLWRLVGFASLAVLAVAVFMSDSRNAWVSVAIGVGVLVLAERMRDRHAFLASLALFIVVMIVGLVALYAADGSREALLPRGDSFRPDIWADVLARVWAGNWWIGQGIATSNDVILEGMVFHHAHNMYLAVLFQGGLIGLLLFLGLIVKALLVLMQHYDKADAKLALGVLGMALPSFLLDGYELVDKVGATWFLFWFPVAVALGLEWEAQFGGAS